MELQLTVISDSASDAAEAAGAISRRLKSLPSVSVSKAGDPVGDAQVETKSDLTLLTTLLVTFLTSGAAVAVVDALKSMSPFSRTSAITFDISLRHGATVSINATGLSQSQVEKLIEHFTVLTQAIEQTPPAIIETSR